MVALLALGDGVAKLTLSDTEVVRTLEKLQARISQRFPDAGLAAVCADLIQTARKTARRAAAAGRPYLFIRLMTLLVMIAGVAGQVWVVSHVDFARLRWQPDIAALAQGTESAVNLLIFAVVALAFLFNLETRVKRARVLNALHELRSFAHVIDMHQLTKDPTVVLSKQVTPASPRREMTKFQLTRYLEYCAEMLSLVGKLAALYGERVHDSQVIEAINDVENLSTNLGRKIWQKITILSALEDEDAAPTNTPVASA